MRSGRVQGRASPCVLYLGACYGAYGGVGICILLCSTFSALFFKLKLLEDMLGKSVISIIFSAHSDI